MVPSRRPDERRPLLEPHSTDEPEQGHFNAVGLSASAFWGLIGSAYFVVFWWFFDGTVVATLLSSISSEFHAANNASWLGTAFLVSGACTAIIWGKLGNILGRRTSFFLSIGLFAAGTLGCSIAPSMPAFIAARALAGIGGGGLGPLTITVQTDALPAELRGTFNGYMNIVGSFGASLGPAIGGPINDLIGWRWAFALQVPFLVLASLLIAYYCRYETDAFWQRKAGDQPEETVWQKLGRIDALGAALFAATIALALVPMTLLAADTNSADPLRLTHPTVLGPLVGSAAAFILFFLVEAYVAAEPIVPYTTPKLRSRTVLCSVVSIFAVSLVQFITLFTVPLFLIVVRQLTPAQASRRLILAPLTQGACALLAGMWIKRTGKYKAPAIFGTLVALVGTIALCFWHAHSPEHLIWWSYPLISSALGVVVTSAYVASTVGLTPGETSMLVSFVWTGRLTGQVLGIAASGIITQFALRSELPKRIFGPNKATIIDQIRKSSDSIRTLPEVERAAAVAAYEIGVQRAFHACVGIAIVALGVSLLFENVNIKQVPRPQAHSEPDTNEE